MLKSSLCLAFQWQKTVLQITGKFFVLFIPVAKKIPHGTKYQTRWPFQKMTSSHAVLWRSEPKKSGHIGGSRITMTHLSHSSHNLGFRSMKRATFYHFNWKFSSILSIPFSMVFFSTVDFTKSVKKHKKKGKWAKRSCFKFSACFAFLIFWGGPKNLHPKKQKPIPARSTKASAKGTFLFFWKPPKIMSNLVGGRFLRYLFNKPST